MSSTRPWTAAVLDGYQDLALRTADSSAASASPYGALDQINPTPARADAITRLVDQIVHIGSFAGHRPLPEAPGRIHAITSDDLGPRTPLAERTRTGLAVHETARCSGRRQQPEQLRPSRLMTSRTERP